MLERQLSKQCQDYLRSLGWFVFKHHGNAYTTPGHSDLYGCTAKGRSFFIELKRKGCKPSLLQERFIKNALDHSAISFWCDSIEDFKKAVDMFKND